MAANTRQGQRAAAIFDLDRTLLADSSGLLLVEALVEKGLVSERDRRIAELTRGFYRRVGETWLGMQITRRGVGRVAGWLVDDVREAAQRSLGRMDAAIYHEARELIRHHQALGHVVCIATSTGREIVEPLAEHLGADKLIATEYESADGRFTGNFIGRWLWGPDKAAAVQEFADREGIDLSESYAYSDSYYDRHLLEIVGYPRPVNPDAILRAHAARKGWPVLEFSNDPAGPRRGLEPADLLLPFSNPLLLPFRLEVSNLEGIPRETACIVAANHRSYMDPVALTVLGAWRGRKLRYLGKKEVFDVPVVGQLMKAFGQIRVDRGTGSTRPLKEALDALSRGEAIGIFPQGTIPRGRAFFEPRLQGRTGAVRLAIASGAPVIPVGMWGTEKVWPRSSRIPNLLSLATRPRMYAAVGEPLILKAPGGQEDDPATLRRLTNEVMDAICALLPDEVRNPGEPTPEQIRLATPAGAG
jgi:putative phosphoserine phosphatase/1-acylglycerol-3-phosphate O-acyltransferase